MAQSVQVDVTSITGVSGGLSVVGTAGTCLWDGNDSTGLSQTSTTPGSCLLGFNWPTLPANTVILGYSITVRGKGLNGRTDRTYVYDTTNPPRADVYVPPLTGASFANYSPGQRSTVLNGLIYIADADSSVDSIDWILLRAALRAVVSAMGCPFMDVR